MPKLLLVPIRVDALCVSAGLSVVQAKADFTRLPYWDGAREINADIANVSEDIVAHPFQDRGLNLARGVHLHWALPPVLTRSEAQSGDARTKVSFPAVPDRWLIRKIGGAEWLVESDYLSAEQDGAGGVSIPFPADRPYRYLGRKGLYDASRIVDPTPQHLAGLGYRLTAVGYQPEPDSSLTGGYSEPTFAAFYPNCARVFGFHDPVLPAKNEAVAYELLGWYSDPAQDFVARFLKKLWKKLERAPTSEELCDALGKLSGWPLDKTGPIPERMACHARISLPALEAIPTATREDKPVSVAVGNTATEALSAYLAQAHAKDLQSTPAQLEEELEALHLASGLEHRVVDIGPKFKEARHGRAFAAVDGGTLWSIRKAGQTAPADQELPLPLQLARRLNELNVCQQACDQAAFRRAADQQQLFADWYKYMLCAYPPDDSRDDYPDLDEVRYFVEKNGLRAMERRQGDEDALLAGCADAKQAVTSELKTWNRAQKTAYELHQRPAPRYYRPHEPVVLLVADGLAPTPRHGPSTVSPALLDIPHNDISADISRIRERLEKISEKKPETGFHTWSEQPWNPFSLQWRVQLSPQSASNNLAPSTRRYAADFIERNYALGTKAVDLAASVREVQKSASIYSGSSLLTPHAKLGLEEAIRLFLTKQLDEDSEARKLIQRVSALIGKTGFEALAQSLNGFNEALLMRRQTLQLPVDEPLGFDDARQFTRAVAAAVEKNTTSAPQPLDDFHPLRTGVLDILALRLVDTFGRTQDLTLKDGKVLATEVMTDTTNPERVVLPPRLVQPARVALRWLSAEPGGQEVEMSSHPATTPVCGWLMVDHLDRSLLVYDANGTALGAISAEGTWVSPPGPSRPEVQKNPHLEGVIACVRALEVTARGKLLEEIGATLKGIEPANAAEQDALALLIGRPLAVVRASLALELRGAPAVNQGWDAFRRDVERDLTEERETAVRETDRVLEIRFPVRLGDQNQLSDGLVGFWTDGDSTFFHAGAALSKRLNETPSKLTMLVDPRGQVHARAGILPVKAIGIPPDQFLPALKALAVTFLTSPILAPAGALALPLPSELGYRWSWLAKSGPTWTRSELGPADGNARWGERTEIREGWLELANAGDDKGTAT